MVGEFREGILWEPMQKFYNAALNTGIRNPSQSHPCRSFESDAKPSVQNEMVGAPNVRLIRECFQIGALQD